MKYFFILFLCFTQFFVQQASCAEKDYTQSNAVYVCENSLETLDWAIEFIHHAEQSIEFSPCFFGGTILKRVFSAIEERLKERPNLQVYVLASPIFFDASDKQIIDRIQKMFPDNFHLQVTATVMTYIPDLIATDNHIKCLIVDELYFTAGGTNFDEVLCTDGKYTPPRNPERAGLGLPGGPAGMRDQDIVGRGPIAKELRVVFHKIYALWEDYFRKNLQFTRDPEVFANKNHYFPLDPAVRPFVARLESDGHLVSTPQIKMFFSGAMHCPNHITQEYNRLINEAKQQIVIGNLYFAPVDSTFQMLKNAVNRGIELCIITNGVRKAPDYTKFFAWAHRISYVPMFYGRDFHLWEIGIAANAPLRKTRIYEYNISDVAYHKKVMVIDQRYTLIGSYNLGLRSDACDYELVFVIDSEEVARHTLEVIKTDRGLSSEVTPKEARGWYFDPITSYLGNQQKKFQVIQG